MTDGRESFPDNADYRGNISLPEEVMIDLEAWLSGTQSKMIWIEGIASGSGVSKLSYAAAKICQSVMRNGLPCITFYCQQSHGFPKATSMHQRDAAVVALIYSIIVQLSYVIPAQFKGNTALREESFRLLGGSIGTLSTALDIVEALLSYTPPTLIWIIDGLQFAGSEITMPSLVRLIEVLRTFGAQDDKVSKVCFTTDGSVHFWLLQSG